MSGSGLLAILGFLAVFVFFPLSVMFCCDHDARRPKPNLRECPQSGAQNHVAQTRCYCCELEFIPSEPIEATPTVIQRVRQADGDRAKQLTVVHSPPASKVA
jgi:hypothetical protein